MHRRYKMKRRIVFAALLVLVLSSITASTLTDWGPWRNMGSNFEFRVRCVRQNTSNGKYVWEVEVHNKTSSPQRLSISIDYSDDWRANTISGGQSYVFPLLFSDSPPGSSITVQWK